MHKLERDPVPPVCLKRYQHGRDTWGLESPTSPDRDDIWDKLNIMQSQRCAYCEVSIERGSRHIEHFRQRSRYSQGTFAWTNLFGSCIRRDTCGDHKDKCGIYEHTDLIKPDEEDPEYFLVFSADGSVNPRADLSNIDHHRATETIRTLNLNGALRQIRRSEIYGYSQTAEYLAELAIDCDHSEYLSLLQDELDQTAHLPCSTAIKHILTRQSR